MNPRPTAQWNPAPPLATRENSNSIQILKGVLLGLVYIAAGIFVCWIALMLAIVTFLHVFLGNVHF